MADHSQQHSGKRKKAVALRYDRDKDQAPVAVGKGIGLTAERIIALAREHGIPIHEDADLVEILAKLELHEQIPPAAYIAVAEILAFIYRANDSYKK
jgi:flagellar biosynthesis protein